ncbi:hypothetical protein A3D03_05010 [Candidatus Gottesmanbacteria bacterium RIFCSPHIGHO2_02_FULL_40_13]|uniref:Lycopene cyclase domain-containing protein n=1 Tax=Candidatus Gottesmanbacteria bacterium RIFCSPHIGHO2_02_FULL_40_13 TaxID=1798384 RepID=A0A1F6ADL5_9BACT|nr:MAG: hypothetical protein A3D03_05010 [Candidatus Gottesmanbacteria bacterium RIFCSPHIGHO2_02_FULL_40_13]
MSYGYLLVVIAMLVIYTAVRRITKLPSIGNTKQKIFLFSCTYLTTLIWDNIAVSSGHWQYKNMLGYFIGYSPIENILFAIVYPLAVITVYQLAIKYLRIE